MRYAKQKDPAKDPQLLFLMPGLIIVMGARVFSIVTISLFHLS